MQNTDFLKLNMPELSDKADIRKISEDMDWIDNAVKTLNEFHATVEQRLTRLELKDEKTDVAIASVRSDVSNLIRNVDGLISRVNALEASQTATAIRVNALSDKVNADITELKNKTDSLSGKVERLDSYFKPVVID